MHHQVDRAPIHALTALSVIVLDWLAFGLGIAGEGHAHGSVLVGSSLLAAMLATASETYLSGQRSREAALTGLFAAVAVAVPLPMLGTVLGTVVIAWNLALTTQQRRAARVR